MRISMTRVRTRLLLGMTLAALASVHLSAHDFWLAAVNWTPVPGTPVTITAGIGERFPTRTNFPSRENWLAEWRVIGPNGDLPVTKEFRRTDLEAATGVSLPSPGAYLGMATVTAQTIDMTGKEFTDYLKEEGLERIIAARAAEGESDKATKERYARYAKIAIRAGGGSAAHLTRPTGMKAEFVPAGDPTSIGPGGSLTVQLLTERAAVAGAPVFAVTEGTILNGQTDNDGRVTFTLGREGAWLIKTVHMRRLPRADPAGAEWESYWVTLAFRTAS